MEREGERSYYRAMLVITVALAIVATVVTILVLIVPGADDPTTTPTTSTPSTPTPSGGPTATPPESPTPPAALPAQVEGRSPVPGWMTLPDAPDPCPDPTVEVTTAAQLQDALDDAGPGAVVHVADGVYEGGFTLTAPATREEPAWLCGGPGAVLDGGAEDSGYTLHLDGASHWTVQGLTVRGGQKGIMADAVTGVTLTGLTVHSTGDEAVHLRRHSTDNVVTGIVVSDTGLREPEFGEGFYIGSAHSNWCDLTDCEPDASDRNRITGNVVFATTAEPVDIKEGTTGGVLADNQLDGAAMTGPVPDSWVAVKGNAWSVVGNEGRHSPADGFQVSSVGPDGWGRGNTFADNTGRLDSDDAVLVDVLEGNTVECSNDLRGGAGTLTNTTCAD